MCNEYPMNSKAQLKRLLNERSASAPFGDAGLHLFVRHEAIGLDVALRLAHGGKKGGFLGDIAGIKVVWQALDGLEDLLFDAHAGKLSADRWLTSPSCQGQDIAENGVVKIADKVEVDVSR